MLTPSGKFCAAQKYVYDKACRALYALRKALKCVSELSVNTQLKLFESVIKPILLYGSEVWGAYLYKFKINIQSLYVMLRDVNSLMEKLHSKICKYILQLHKSANHYAIRCELGRYPLFINVICRILNYYINICERSEDSVVKIALKLHESNSCSWYTFVNYIVQILGLNLKELTKSGIKRIKNSIFNKLFKLSQDIYFAKLVDYNKLKLYASIKTKPCKEKYLHLVNDSSSRKVLSQLRLSCHKFPIETGRYHNIQSSERLCKLCNMSIGSEQHCIIECFHPTLFNIRNNFLKEIFKINKELCKLPRYCLFKYILLFSDQTIILPCTKYISEIFNAYPK
jgi:hypothetical protein